MNHVNMLKIIKIKENVYVNMLKINEIFFLKIGMLFAYFLF